MSGHLEPLTFVLFFDLLLFASCLSPLGAFFPVTVSNTVGSSLMRTKRRFLQNFPRLVSIAITAGKMVDCMNMMNAGSSRTQQLTFGIMVQSKTNQAGKNSQDHGAVKRQVKQQRIHKYLPSTPDEIDNNEHRNFINT
jgi:hypothetical protein